MPKQLPGTTGGFHYGTSDWPCNGVLHATDREHTDGRQIYACDACGRESVKNWETLRAEDEAHEAK